MGQANQSGCHDLLKVSHNEADREGPDDGM